MGFFFPFFFLWKRMGQSRHIMTKKFRNEHIQRIISRMQPKCRKIPKLCYFPLLPVAKFGKVLLWTIANPLLPHQFEKRTLLLTTCAIWFFFFFFLCFSSCHAIARSKQEFKDWEIINYILEPSCELCNIEWLNPCPHYAG